MKYRKLFPTAVSAPMKNFPCHWVGVNHMSQDAWNGSLDFTKFPEMEGRIVTEFGGECVVQHGLWRIEMIAVDESNENCFLNMCSQSNGSFETWRVVMKRKLRLYMPDGRVYDPNPKGKTSLDIEETAKFLDASKETK